MHWRLLSLFGSLLLTFPGELASQEARPPLSEAQQAEAKRLMTAIRKDPRGPYGPIWWYCKDGQKLPPRSGPCPKPGGFQHAERSAAAQRLAALDLDVGRLLAGLDFEAFFDAGRNHYGLRELVMLDYLTARDDGWIYASTFSRRGVRQAEDEASEGRRLLMALLARHDWVAKHYLLALQVVATTPHGADTSRIREIRALSAKLAEALPAFQPLRGKIHSRPETRDIAAVREFVSKNSPADAEGFHKLIALMEQEYGEQAARPGFDLARQAQRSLEIRQQLTQPGWDAAQRLRAADEQLRIQDLAFQAGSRPSPDTRRARLDEVLHWLRVATGGGWLSMRQLSALEGAVGEVLARENLKAPEYEELTAYLEGGAEWARATAVMTVGEVEARYAVVEPLAKSLSDELLRRSVMLPLANRIELLTRDSDLQMGRQHRLLEATSRRGIRAFNPGVARGRLELLESAENTAEIEPDRIYVIPATAAELKPMRGILTLDSGNALSHVQLLAANLGIPNATVPSSLLRELKSVRGQEVFYAVTPGGTVVLRPWASLSSSERSQWENKQTARQRVALDTSKTNTQDRALRLLEETSMADSGVLCGPKAANLGQLKRLFPQVVAPGVVIPFGIYYAHAVRKSASGPSVIELVQSVYRESERLRAAGASPDEQRKFIRPRLAEIRERIRTMPLEEWFTTALTARMQQTFGSDGTYGVFVRSDTNAEDLPQFTGAGLNLTLPNVIGEAKSLQAVKDVWASPFEKRAWAWRSEALEASDRVYPSVVLLRTVPSDKSGVMATANLSTLNLEDLTVNVNEGVAAVVDGGVSESLLLTADGRVKLLAQARAGYRKVPSPKGGFVNLPSSGSDTVLTGEEIALLRGLARDVHAKLSHARDGEGRPLPWDIEFGFEKGELRLFQIRPLVRYREANTLEALGTLETVPETPRLVVLDAPLENE